jgi:hypothetical protein
MKGILLGCQIESIVSRKDRTIKIILGTQELSPSKAGELFSLLNHIASVYIASSEIDQSEIDQVDKIDPEFKGKSQSQRLRNVLYLLYEQDKEGFKEFDSYYRYKMDQIIDTYKSNIH